MLKKIRQIHHGKGLIHIKTGTDETKSGKHNTGKDPDHKMLTYNLEKRNGKPMYQYLYECIRNDIENGKLKSEEKLPSKRMFAQHLKVGVITVANAYDQLAAEGYIISKEKKGYYVADLPSFPKHKKNRLPKITEEEPEEKEYFADFKANRTSLHLFPANTWNYYMREALSLKDNSLLKTVPYKGLYILRHSIAEFLERNRGISVSPSQIIIGAGTEYLYSRIIQLFNPDAVFGFEDPGYKKFTTITGSLNRKWKYIQIDESGLIVTELEKHGVDIVHVSPSNHFPTGIIMPVARRIELFDWAGKAKNRYIIEDDYDSELRFSGHLIMPMFSQDTQGKVVYINTFSKSLVPSLRISYMILPPDLLEQYEKTLSFYSCTVSSFEQYTLANFIKNGHFERHINRMRNYYRKQRLLMLHAIEASPLAKISDIYEWGGGTHFILNVHTDLSEDEIRKAALKEDIMISLFSDFSNNPHNIFLKALIINYAGIDQDKMDEVVRRLENIFINSTYT